MSGIAEVLLKLGYGVTGSDLVKNAEVSRLSDMGAVVSIGHAGKNIGKADVVVTSTAVSKDNPEVKEAQKRGVPVIRRVEMLAEIARLKYTIAIAGTHGKTTTSSMVGQVFKFGGLDPTVIVGGRLKAVGTGGVLGAGDYLVAEADESDGSFLKLSPTINIITNIDNDHLDYYKTKENLKSAFVEFANHIPFYGMNIVCWEDPIVRKILPLINRRYQTYGFDKKCDLRATDLVTDPRGSTFTVTRNGQVLGPVTVPLYGKHNVLNALAALGAGLQVDLPFRLAAEALSQFAGVGRRIEVRGESRGVTVVDDYGHHPTEMKATIAALRQRWPERRLVVLFQPHRFTRTQALYKDFAAALNSVDRLVLMPIYPAGEKPIKGVTSQLIAKNLKKKNWEWWTGDETLGKLLVDLKSGDVLLTLGAGDVWKIGEKYLTAASLLAHQIKAAVPSLDGRIKSEEPLSRHSTWGIGGPAEVFVEVHNVGELNGVTRFCRERKISTLILGWGSNVLLPDEGIRGCVLRLRGDFEAVHFDGNQVRLGAGVHLPKLSKRCAEKGLAGTEALAGIPGTIGGALVMNAGTPRGVIGDVLVSADILNEDGSVSTLAKDKIRFGYRESSLAGSCIVGAVLNLKFSTDQQVQERIATELTHREKTQPLGTKNAGSVFRNPPQDYAARLIEAAGLKGQSIGGMRVSPKHANFFENTGGGTAKDALALVEFVRSTVKEKFNIELQLEVKIVRQPPLPS